MLRIRFTRLERTAINGLDEENRDLIPYRKRRVNAPSLLTGFALFFSLLLFLNCTKPQEQSQVKNTNPDTTQTVKPKTNPPKDALFIISEKESLKFHFENGYFVKGAEILLDSTGAGEIVDLQTGYFIKTKEGKTNLIYLSHFEDPNPSRDLDESNTVFELQFQDLKLNEEIKLIKTNSRFIFYRFQYMPNGGKFYQARKGEGTIKIIEESKDSLKGYINLFLTGKSTDIYGENPPLEEKSHLISTFKVPVRTLKQIKEIEAEREKIALEKSKEVKQ